MIDHSDLIQSYPSKTWTAADQHSYNLWIINAAFTETTPDEEEAEGALCIHQGWEIAH